VLLVVLFFVLLAKLLVFCVVILDGFVFSRGFGFFLFEITRTKHIKSKNQKRSKHEK
tara:strand:- start:800 stop:970 length:171 start_codon:yes stop_codon:yes gene_type:complete